MVDRQCEIEMRENMKKIVSALGSAAVLAVFATACNHKELCYDHRHTTVRVDFDWSEDPAAAPSGMCVLFYPSDGGAPVVKAFAGCDGGRASIPAGDYDVICYNTDAAEVSWRGDASLVTIEAYTRESSVTEGLDDSFVAPPRSDAAEPVVAAPGRLWSCRLDGVRLESGGGEAENVVLLAPRRVTRRVCWEMTSVTNGGNLTGVRAVLSGVSGSLRLGSVMPVPGGVSIPSAGVLDASDPEKLTGGFDCFGCCGDISCRHLLTIYCWSPGGNVMASWDVTDQVHAAGDADEIRLVVTGHIVLPDGSDGGFAPGVGGWDDKQNDVIM